ncbi:transcription factor, contains a PHD finger motif [Umbelopsis sp. WA50703]
MTNYTFQCAMCREEEFFERITASWKDICWTAIANLILQEVVRENGPDRSLYTSKNAHLMEEEWQPEKYFFNKKDHIIPFVDANWKSICTDRARTTTWWATLGSTLYTAKDMFVTRDESHRTAASDFCLVDANLWNVRPNAVQTGTPSTSSTPKPIPREKVQKAEVPVSTPVSSPSPTASPTPTVATFPQTSQADHPYNRYGFKYTPCKASSIFKLVNYRQEDANGCALSTTDRSPYASISRDGMVLTTDKGWRMCRSNVGVRHGTWYWEATILPSQGSSSDGPHVRLGWARREASLDAPVGFDAYSYGYRDVSGEKLFSSRREKYGEGFQVGDVIGLMITLPQAKISNFKSPNRRRIPIAYKDALWFEEKDFKQSKEYEALANSYQQNAPKNSGVLEGWNPRMLENSRIEAFKNGKSQGIMFDSLYDYEDFGRLAETIKGSRRSKKRKANTDASSTSMMGNGGEEDDAARRQQWTEEAPIKDDGTLGYYPAVSVYGGGVVSCNFGPHFLHPPTGLTDWRPMSERWDEYMAEETVWDLVDEVDRRSRRANI